jgi:hypothetical protein
LQSNCGERRRGDAYLAVANSRWSVSNFSPDSRVYRWNGAGFAEMPSIPTDSAHNWEAFTIGSELYLAVAHFRNDSTWMRDSVIYRAILAPGQDVYLPILLNGFP